MNKRLDISFPYTSKTEWMALIKAGLKGKPIEDLNVEFEPTHSISPFQHLEDTSPEANAPLGLNDNRILEIGEDLTNLNFSSVNKYALDALTYGANTLRVSTQILESVTSIEQALNGIHLDMIHLDFVPDSDLPIDTALLHYRNYIDSLPDSSNITAEIAMSPNQLEDFIIKHRDIYEALNGQYMTRWVQFHTAISNPISTLTGMFTDLISLMECGHEIGVNAFGSLKIEVEAGEDFLTNIAALRAIHILLANLKRHAQDTDRAPFITGSVLQNVENMDPRLGYIPVTYKAMSLLSGGAQRLYLKISPQNEESNRIVRNINHLLTLESDYNLVSDPAAGSYYIENLTLEIVKSVWDNLI